jgi:hypothetical protein
MIVLASWPGWLSPWEWTTADWAGVTFFAIAAAAFVAWRQVKEAQALREEQARPFVVIDFEPWTVFIDLKISNVGNTIARDVQFEFDPPLAAAKDERAGLIAVAETNLFKNGIPSLPPGKEITLFFDQFPQRKDKNLPDKYSVDISYTSPSGKKYSERTVLDLGIYFGVGQITRHDIHDVHKQLEKISKTLAGWTHAEGLKIMSREDRKQYRDELYAAHEQREQDSDDETTDQ